LLDRDRLAGIAQHRQRLGRHGDGEFESAIEDLIGRQHLAHDS